MALSGENVLQVLVAACSQDTSQLKPAEQQLGAWETQPGFYSLLSNIFTDHSFPVNVRWLAVLYFKNGVNRYWRKHAQNGISEEEKSSLRNLLVSKFNEPVPQVAMQWAILIAKIARLDCPRSWPELIPTLLQAIRVQDELCQYRAMLTLHHVTKALASRCLAHDKKVFQELTGSIYSFIFELWRNHTNVFLKNLPITIDNRQVALTAISQGHLAMKVLRKLVIYGKDGLQNKQDADILLRDIFEKIPLFLQSKQHLIPTDNEFHEKRQKVLLLFTKVLLDMLDYHAADFVNYIQPSLELSVNCNFTEMACSTNNEILFGRFTVNTMNIMLAILRSQTYKPAKYIQDTKNPITLQAHDIKQAFFTQPVLEQIIQRLVNHYFLLTQHETECWQTDPEGFVSEEGGDDWKFDLQPCTENLYTTIMKEEMGAVIPIVLSMMKQLQEQQGCKDMQTILLKDAVYKAVGLVPYVLSGEFNFSQWFTDVCVHDLQVEGDYRIVLQRRLVWLLGCWVSVDFESSLKPSLYQLLLKMIQPDQDLVVRIETAKTLRSVVDVYEFDNKEFVQYLDSAFSALFELLKAVSESETKMRVLNVMACLTERMGNLMGPNAGILLQYLPVLWQDAEDHNMLRCTIVTTLICLVQVFKTDCTELFSFLLPIIRLSTDVKEDTHIYLLDDGLDLWEMTLNCTPVMTPELLALSVNVLPLLEQGSETIQPCLRIVEDYLLLDHRELIKNYGDALIRTLTSIMTDMKSDGIVMVMRVVELAMQVLQEDGPIVLAVFTNPAIAMITNREQRLETGEVAVYLCFISRLILQNQMIFFDHIKQVAANFNMESGALLHQLLDSWLDQMDMVVDTEDRKLCVLALVSLLPHGDQVILHHFPGIINCCVEALHDVCQPEDDNTQTDCLLLSATEEPDGDLSEHEKRHWKFRRSDPVHRVQIQSFIMNKIRCCQSQCSEEQFQHLQQTVDSEVWSQLVQFSQ